METQVHPSVANHPILESLPSVNSSQLKNNFGETLVMVGRNGVAITRHKRIEYVLLAATTYLELKQSQQTALDALGRKFDDMVTNMNTPKARQGVRKFFQTTSPQLGRTALKAANA